MACISSDLALKRLQLLQQIVPRLSRLAVLFNGGVPAKVAELQDIMGAAKILEIDMQPADVRDASGFAAAFAAIKGGNPEALITLADPLTFILPQGDRRVRHGTASADDVRVQRVLRLGWLAVLWHEPHASI